MTSRIEMIFQGVFLAVYYDGDEGYIEDAEIIIDGGETDWFFDSLNEHKREQLEEAFHRHIQEIKGSYDLDRQLMIKEDKDMEHFVFAKHGRVA